jgi:hypothetical protein
MTTSESVREALATLASTRMELPLTEWQRVSSIILAAAAENEQLQKRVTDLECDLETLDRSGGFGAI